MNWFNIKWFKWLTAAWLFAFLGSFVFIMAWMAFDAMTDPSAEQIQHTLEKSLGNQADRGSFVLRKIELVPDGAKRYKGTAEWPNGTAFRLTVELRDIFLEYTGNPVVAERDDQIVGSFGGSIRSPAFLDRHSWSKPVFFGSALLGNIFGVIFPLGGFLGLRKTFRPGLEVVLYICAVLNLGIAIGMGYQFVESLRIAQQ
jgi:hypothetical protein